ncbi:MAG TPA: ferritin family protein [Candidatus Omnitrophota bacterium]|nr:ferritin family protein [Candidatus Omnitrophota bacterium]HPS36311.1 ferritin family protein [Candidatus Omnitrophota bacterium]
MKVLSKILIVTLFFSLPLAIFAYAEDVKVQEQIPVVMPEAAPAATPAPAAEATAPAVAPAPVEVAPTPVEKTTLENLQAAFNGESNANAKYLAFAKKADEEGYGRAASLFRAAARAEQVHFERHAKVIKGMGGTPTAKIETPEVKTTPENLKNALDGETYESTIMYPGFLKKAEADNNKDATDAFEDANAAEAVHASLYKEALADLKAWKRGNKNFYVCPVCGNVVERMGFKNCPICDTNKRQFMAVK